MICLLNANADSGQKEKGENNSYQYQHLGLKWGRPGGLPEGIHGYERWLTGLVDDETDPETGKTGLMDRQLTRVIKNKLAFKQDT